MRIVITSNTHPHYDQVGEVIQKEPDGRWRVRIPSKEGSIVTLVRDKDFKEIKRQEDEAGTPSQDGRYQADGLGCVERVSGAERDWLDPAAHNPRGY